MALYNGINELVGKTPLLCANGFSKEAGLSSPLYVKLECFNPAGSVKDRAALYMINDAEARGVLKKAAPSSNLQAAIPASLFALFVRQEDITQL